MKNLLFKMCMGRHEKLEHYGGKDPKLRGVYMVFVYFHIYFKCSYLENINPDL